MFLTVLTQGGVAHSRANALGFALPLGYPIPAHSGWTNKTINTGL